MIEWGNKEITISRQCKFLGISRSTAYYKLVPPGEEEIKIKNAIGRIYTVHPCYDCRRIQSQLLDRYDICIGRKKVRRYMREIGIDAIYPRINLSKKSKQNYRYSYLLRNVQIMHKNQAWDIDLTYIGVKRLDVSCSNNRLIFEVCSRLRIIKYIACKFHSRSSKESLYQVCVPEIINRLYSSSQRKRYQN
ncbi:transposase [Thermoanaerobacteraceae bacterium SP2]|nr:transposase [Thermoanaerobacteraceae bacterium SP2]